MTKQAKLLEELRKLLRIIAKVQEKRPEAADCPVVDPPPRNPPQKPFRWD